jgi:hypothetical protein
VPKRIHWAFLSGSVARAADLATRDVDLMTIGTVGSADRAPALHRTEKRLRRVVNPTLYTREEFGTKLCARDHVLTSMLDGAQLGMRGESHALAAAPSPSPGPGTRRQPQST